MQAIDTSKLETALKEMREKVKSISQENGIDLSQGTIMGTVGLYGNWGDYTYGGFDFNTFEMLDREIDHIRCRDSQEFKESRKLLTGLLKPIEKEYDTIIGDFVEEVLDFNWDDGIDFSYWYQESGGEVLFSFILGDDKIEVDMDLSLCEVAAHTQYAQEVSFDDDFWTDEQKAHLLAIDQLGLEYIIRAEFSGSGDSGGYDGSYVFEDFECTKCIPREDYKPILDKIDGDVESIGYAIMDSSDVDWYNNEGGGGHILIDLKNRKVHIDVWQNFDENETVWSDKIVFQN